MADRFALETAFHDGEEVVGSRGQRQVRFESASIDAFHLCFSTFNDNRSLGLGPAGGGVGRPRGSRAQ